MLRDLSDQASSQDLLGGRYLPVKEIGSGGSGVVYEAVHHLTRERVAIKVIELKQLGDNQRTVARFMREAKLSHQIHNNGVVKVIDAWIDDQRRCCLVMELLRGMSLREVIDCGKIKRARVLQWVVNALGPLEAAHRAGVIHRDIKPENIYIHIPPVPEGDTLITSKPMFFDEELGELRALDERDMTPIGDLELMNEPELTFDVTDVELIENLHRAQVKLLDFGLSRSFISPSVTQTGHFVGTPWYMSPEQIFSPKQCTHVADLWSMGVIFYEVLTDELPFKGESIPELCLAVRDQPVPSIKALRPELPQALVDSIELCLQKDPQARAQSAAQIKYQFETALTHFNDSPYAQEKTKQYRPVESKTRISEMKETVSALGSRGELPQGEAKPNPPLAAEFTDPDVSPVYLDSSEESTPAYAQVVNADAASDAQGASPEPYPDMPSLDEDDLAELSNPSFPLMDGAPSMNRGLSPDQVDTLQLNIIDVRGELDRSDHERYGVPLTAELTSQEVFKALKETPILDEEGLEVNVETPQALEPQANGEAPSQGALLSDSVRPESHALSQTPTPLFELSNEDSVERRSSQPIERDHDEAGEKYLVTPSALGSERHTGKYKALTPSQATPQKSLSLWVIILFVLGVGLGVLIRFLGLV